MYQNDTAYVAPSGGGAGSSCVLNSSLIQSYAAGTGAGGAAGIAGNTTNGSSVSSGGNGSVTVNPYTSISVTKVSSVLSDPVNGSTNPKAIPGALVQYCITVTNSGPSQATSVTVTDPLPSTTTYVTGTLADGTSCAAASTSLLSGSTASYSAGTVTGTMSTLASGSSLALVFRVTVN